MSQAEIAGGAVAQANELPSKGRRFRDFVLRSTDGRLIRLSDYRGRSNLVLIFADDRSESKQLLSQLASEYANMKNEQAEVLAIVCSSPQKTILGEDGLKFPYPVLVDEDRSIHYQAGAVDQQGGCAAAVYVTDRFGEVFGLYRTRDNQPLPKVADILNWLEFINSQCPECEPPEWPL